jgi:hypothetical protein
MHGTLPETIDTLLIRVATESDLRAIVSLLADDMLGQQRESLADPLPESYALAFVYARTSCLIMP